MISQKTSEQAKEKKSHAIPGRVVFGLLLAILLDTVVQTSWKYCVLQSPENAGLLELFIKTASQPLFWLTITLFIAQFVNWMTVLDNADLSFAQPITAMSYVTVGIVSIFFLHESITLAKMVGVVLILGGVFLISGTKHDTMPRPENSK